MLNVSVNILDRIIGTATPISMEQDTMRVSWRSSESNYDLTDKANDINLTYPSFEATGFDLYEPGYIMPTWIYTEISSSQLSPGHSHYIRWPDENSDMYLLVPDDHVDFVGYTRYDRSAHTLINDSIIGVLSSKAYRTDMSSDSAPSLRIRLSEYRNHFSALTLYFNRYAFNGKLSFYDYDADTGISTKVSGSTDISFTADPNSLKVTIADVEDHNYIYNELLITFTSPLVTNTMVGVNYIILGTTVTVSNTDSNNALIDPIELFGEVPVLFDDMPLGTCSFTIKTNVKPYEDQEVIVTANDDGFSFEGKYIIEKAERQGYDVYSISAKDTMAFLDNISIADVSVSNHHVNSYLSKVETISGLSMPRLPISDDDIEILLEEGIENARQYLSAICFARGLWISTFGNVDGPKIIKDIVKDRYPDNTDNVRPFSDTRVFYAPEYQKQEAFDGVTYNYKDTEYMYKFPFKKNLEPNYKSVNQMNSKIYNGTLSTAIPALLEQNSKYLNAAIAKGEMLYSGEKLGDLVSMPTKYDGNVTGYIQSINLKLSTVAIATIEVRSIHG